MGIVRVTTTQRREGSYRGAGEVQYEWPGFGMHMVSVAHMQRQGWEDCASNNSKRITWRGGVQVSQKCLVGPGRVAGRKHAASL